MIARLYIYLFIDSPFNIVIFHDQEEWVVCRVFQKSSTVKRPQQTPSSPPSQAESPCDTTAMVNELGDIELPNFSSNSMAISSSTNIALQNNYNTHDTNMMNWNAAAIEAAAAAANSLPSLTWPLLSTNLSMNSLLLTALQLRGHHHQPRGTITTSPDNYSFMPQAGNINHQFGNDFSSNFNIGSTSGVVDSVPQPPSEQPPYNVDSSIWWRVLKSVDWTNKLIKNVPVQQFKSQLYATLQLAQKCEQM